MVKFGPMILISLLALCVSLTGCGASASERIDKAAAKAFPQYVHYPLARDTPGGQFTTSTGVTCMLIGNKGAPPSHAIQASFATFQLQQPTATSYAQWVASVNDTSGLLLFHTYFEDLDYTVTLSPEARPAQEQDSLTSEMLKLITDFSEALEGTG